MMLSMEECCGVQPSMSSAFAALATRLGGSPARGGPDCAPDLGAGHALNRIRQLFHRCARPRAQIEDLAFVAGVQPIERAQVRVGEIGHMHIVPHAGAVARMQCLSPKIVNVKSPSIAPLMASGITRGSWLLRSPVSRLRIGAGGVEIAQDDRTQSVGRAEILDDPLADQLGRAIRVDWRLAALLR